MTRKKVKLSEQEQWESQSKIEDDREINGGESFFGRKFRKGKGEPRRPGGQIEKEKRIALMISTCNSKCGSF